MWSFAFFFDKKIKIMNKRFIIAIAILIAFSIIFWYFSGNKKDEGISTVAKSGEFVISVVTSGELDAKTSTNIQGPEGLRSVGIYEDLKLNEIIPEGTEVDSGDYIASIDQTPILNKLKEVDANLEKFDAKISQSKLDSALTLRADRDNLINLKYALEELELELKNSEYESPVTKEKLRINIEKNKRQYNQALNNYKLKKRKEENTVRTAIIDYQKEMSKKDNFINVLKGFKIIAPQAGMLIYAKTWSGKKISSGSKISIWNPVVAKLPDLSQMIVKTYVNEIDISKIKVDQQVNITVDAFPEKKLTGTVTSVANIGEELQNTSAHVFEVVIKLNETDPDLRPSMTTKNNIIVETLESATYIPLECLNTKDSISFVYSDGKKIQVTAGKSNQDEIVITDGIKAGDKLFLVPPEGADEWSLKLLK